ncbi:transporter [uncultured Paracoccus sp.]|uniref:transporter n=1 Tax=uncultured Paracoccus sp. TaxID=189685 RepID=UPI002604E0FA|nr:transporter [uncultured Paracoccus sp.]
MSTCINLFRLTGLALLAAPAAFAQDVSDLAKDLSNPVASLISVPYQLNYDSGIGPDGNGTRSTLNVQPVVPFSLGEDWNLISRTIIPFVHVSDIVPGESRSGMGDVVQSFFLSPKAPTDGGLIWGAGPVFLLPTATNDLGADQFAAGVTGVVLKQSGPWTFGALANHLWDVGGGSDATDISATFFQPFVSYSTPDAMTISFNAEATYDWVQNEGSLPLNLVASKVVKVGPNLLSVGGGIRYWADAPENGPDGWGARAVVTFLFPR